MTSFYTDGACASNPGPGGWAVAFVEGDTVRTISGLSTDTTNNKMELTAVIEAYKKILSLKVMDPRDKTEYEIVSDSAYVINAITNNWVENWKSNGWKNGKGERVKNAALWKEFMFVHRLASFARMNVKFRKVKGHAGEPMNEIADSVAVSRKIEAVKIVEYGKVLGGSNE